MKSGPGPEPHGGNRRCGGESPFFYLKALPRKKKFSTAGSDAAVGNLVFSIKKRFPEKHNVFHGRIRRCDGKSRFFYLKAFPRKKAAFSTAGSDARFYKSYSCSIVLHFSSRIQLERLILQTLCSGFRGSRCLFAFRDQLERLITQTRSVVQLYYCFPRGISWNAWFYKPYVQRPVKAAFMSGPTRMFQAHRG